MGPTEKSGDIGVPHFENMTPKQMLHKFLFPKKLQLKQE